MRSATRRPPSGFRDTLGLRMSVGVDGRNDAASTAGEAVRVRPRLLAKRSQDRRVWYSAATATLCSPPKSPRRQVLDAGNFRTTQETAARRTMFWRTPHFSSFVPSPSSADGRLRTVLPGVSGNLPAALPARRLPPLRLVTAAHLPKTRVVGVQLICAVVALLLFGCLGPVRRSRFFHLNNSSSVMLQGSRLRIP